MKPFLAAVALIALALITAPAALADTPGLVAAYGFEEPSGTAAVDSAAGLNPGTLSGPTRSASGRFGAALAFDGVNDRVDVADSASLDLTTGMTLEAWVRPDSGGWRTALLKERPGGLAYALYSSTDSNTPSAELRTSASPETRGPSALPTGTWSHLATTYDGATLRLYVNGTQVSSKAVTGSLAVTTGALRIGGNAIWGEYFAGVLDEVRVYNRALTAGEIQTDMGRAIVATDTTAPTVTVGGACGGATVADHLTLHPTWSDDQGPVTLRIEVDGQTAYGAVVLTGTSGTLAWEWETHGLTNGAHVMRAIARDAAGNETVSDPCQWNVDNPAAAVPITSHADGQTITGTT
jgi:hypothetical protein